MRENVKQGDKFLKFAIFLPDDLWKMFFQITVLNQSILIAQENNVLETFFYFIAIDLLRKSIIELAITQYIKLEFD